MLILTMFFGIFFYFDHHQDKSQINVLLLENVNARAVQMLRDEGYQVRNAIQTILFVRMCACVCECSCKAPSLRFEVMHPTPADSGSLSRPQH